MELIDKAAVVAEIEKRIKETESMQPKFDQFWAGQISAFKGVLKILDTLEVKEIDLEKEANECWNYVFSELGWDKNSIITMKHDEFMAFAKHFFELGMRASNPLTWEDIKLIWNITDEMDNMQEEEFYREVLKRFKAQKGE